MDEGPVLDTADIELHLLTNDEAEDFQEVFSRTWSAEPLRGLSATEIEHVALAGTAVIALLLTKLKEVACRRRHRGVSIYTGDSEITVIKLTDGSAESKVNMRADVLSDPPGGILMVVKQNGDVELHDLCKGSFNLNNFVELLNR